MVAARRREDGFKAATTTGAAGACVGAGAAAAGTASTRKQGAMRCGKVGGGKREGKGSGYCMKKEKYGERSGDRQTGSDAVGEG